MKNVPTLGNRPITAKQRESFLANLAATGNVSRSAQAVGRSRGGFYKLKRTEVEFSEAWDQAMEAAADELEAEARRRAVDGVDEPIVYRGAVAKDADGRTVTVKRYSDVLLMFLLNGARPEKYKQIKEQRHTGPDGGPLQVDVRQVLFTRLFPDEPVPSGKP